MPRLYRESLAELGLEPRFPPAPQGAPVPGEEYASRETNSEAQKAQPAAQVSHVHKDLSDIPPRHLLTADTAGAPAGARRVRNQAAGGQPRQQKGTAKAASAEEGLPG